ncbi:uncharacterized protein E0L32_012373 [Thyridium curvatum]|uniref:Cellular morphogenesis protein n=1 Tax=Thyridium curvatum TaxID=1093900 RepID=A0A507B3G5_9PEZI|nr:uncharacterized protein E0L32_012373 [Thyridium curvatum]TPX16792.1 hypothetical protein E0L32_012373 [Thyridium curvatum]
MRIPFRRRHGARSRPHHHLSYLLAISSVTSLSVDAITFTPAPEPNLDLSQLGSIGIAGDFSGISLFKFEEQTEKPFSTNGSEALLARMPNGAFASVVKTDASIKAMCPFVMKDGTLSGVVMGGDFTSLGDLESPAIALFNPNSSKVTPLSGLSGQVNAVLCDQETETVYVGGNFKGANSTNAISWVGTSGWTRLPFAGFNGPVTSIVKASNGNIIFGGQFTGLGNTTNSNLTSEQVINLSAATYTTESSSTLPGFSDPKNIICKTSGVDGPGNTWLLQNTAPGSLKAEFKFGFEPTRLRLYNTHQDGRGTKTFRFTAFPINGIMNFTYIDPKTGSNASCTSECPLSDDRSLKFQDFHFVNNVGMNAFRLDISDWYGQGGGLNGIELVQSDMFAYAINDFNEPTCSGSATISSASATGPFTVSPSFQSQSEYLTAQLQAPISSNSASITFTPDVRQSGNYSVNMYTPGCLQDNTCNTRGQVNITVFAQSGQPGTSIQLYQTNNFDKYDQIYFGFLEATNGFRPTVQMTPLNGQSLPTMTFVAQRIGLTQINSTGGLNGLYEYDPKSAEPADISSFEKSAFDKLGSTFASKSAVHALATAGDVTFVGGNFTSKAVKNIASVNSKDSTTQALDSGLNGAVTSMLINGTNLFVGGKFTATDDGKVKNLNNVAVYDTAKNTWSALGSGVNGAVNSVVALTMNVTSTTPEVVVAVTGDFKELSAFGNNPAVAANGFGVWVPSQSNWLRNLDLPVETISGVLSTSVLQVPGGEALYAGSISSSSLSANGAASLGQSISRFPVKIQASSSTPSQSSKTKRDILTSGQPSGVVTGLFNTDSNRNLTIMGGHFTATGTDGSSIHNLVLIDGTKNNAVTGLGSGVADDSTFVTMAAQKDNLYAGGNVTGTVNGARVNGLISYNLASRAFNPQPPALSGRNGTVSSIAVRPNNDDVYVGGSFASAGSLGCPAVCVFRTAVGQWSRPGLNLDGTVNTLLWTSETKLVAGGSVTVNGSSTTTFLATYDPNTQTWDSFPDAAKLPGPVSVMTAGTSDGSQLWVAGSAPNGSVYLMKYDGKTWNSAGVTLDAGTEIRGLQIFSLTSNHASSPLVDANKALVLTGSIKIPKFGSTSAAIFNGTTFEPYVLTTNSGNQAGTISRIFVQKENFFTVDNGKHMPLVGVVLIGLAISLGLMLLIVAAGLLLDRIRKKREGYMPAPTSMYDRSSGIQRVPPRELLESLGRGQPAAPRV